MPLCLGSPALRADAPLTARQRPVPQRLAATPRVATPRTRRAAVRFACRASAAPAPSLLSQQLLASATVAAAVFTLGSLLSRAGRERWRSLFASWVAKLPSNASVRRSLGWLLAISVTKGLEGASGLPLLNWVYVAFFGSTMLQAISAAAAAGSQRAAVAVAAAAAAEASGGGEAQPAPPRESLQESLASSFERSLFTSRFPELEGDEVLCCAPVMLGSAGSSAQGQLYVTASALAFHGAFGRSRRIIAASAVLSCQLEGAQRLGRALTLLNLEVEGAGLVTLTAVNEEGVAALRRTQALCERTVGDDESETTSALIEPLS